MNAPFTINVEQTGDVSMHQFMTLRMERFRHISELSLQLPLSGVVLLDGPSGIGKTTLIDAISFVLYDNMGNSCYHRSQRNSRKKHEPTWVELSLPINGSVLNIYRQRRSNLLRITAPGIELLDDSAQAYIDQIFGPYNTWLVGCYIRQEKPCGFFTMNSHDKLALLQQLTLPSRYDHSQGRLISGSEQFDNLLGRTVEKITQMSEQVREAEIHTNFYAQMYMNKYNQLTDEVKTAQLWPTDLLQKYYQEYQVNNLQEVLPAIDQKTHETVQLIQKKISDQHIHLTQMQEAQKQYQRLKEMKASLQTQLAELASTKDQLEDLEKALAEVTQKIATAHTLEKDISNEQVRLTQMQETQKQYQKLEQMKAPLEEQLSDLPLHNPESVNSLEESLSEVINQIALSHKSNRRKQLLTTKAELQKELDKITDDKSQWSLRELEDFEKLLNGPTIPQLQEQLQQIPSAQTYLQNFKLYQTQQQLQAEVEQFKAQLKDYPSESSQNQIDQIGQKIWSRTLQEKKLTCPQCSSELYLNQGQLNTIPEEALGKEHNSIHELHAEKEALQKKENLYQQRTRMDQQLQAKEQKLTQFKATHVLNDFDVNNKPALADYSLEQLDTLNTNLQQALQKRMKVPDNIDVDAEKHKIRQDQKRSQLHDNINSITAQLSDLPVEDMPAEVTSLEQRKQELRNEIQQAQDLKHKRGQLQSNLEQIQQQIDALPKESLETPDCTHMQKLQADLKEVRQTANNCSLEEHQKELRQQIQKAQQIQNKRSQLQSNLEQIQNQINTIDTDLLQEPSENVIETLQKELTEVQTQAEDFKKQINIQLQLQELQQMYQQHAQVQERHQQMNARLNSLHKIKSTLITAEYIILDMFLNHVNQQLAEVLEPLFNEPINVSLRSLKQLKTDQRIKPQINYEINIDGTECASINEVSGGERSRISLALAIVFSSFNQAPFLLLDESLSTLDAEIKEAAMGTIRKYLSNKLVMAVNHDTTTGVYDSVIKLKK